RATNIYSVPQAFQQPIIQLFENRPLVLFDCGSLGCKRSRVQIPAARPNSSKTYVARNRRSHLFGVQLESISWDSATPAPHFREAQKQPLFSLSRWIAGFPIRSASRDSRGWHSSNPVVPAHSV